MDPFFWLIGVVGACIGSFLNVLITRLPDPERTLLKPRFSACPNCDAPIRARDNVPLLGYLLLRGQCRDCKSRISILYPLVESAAALIAVLAYFLHGPTFAGLSLAVLLLLLLATAITDARTYLIPDLYTLGGAVLGLTFAFLAEGWVWALRLAGDALFVATFLWVLGFVVRRRTKKEALGFGDVLLVGMMATFLGFGSTVLAIYVAAISGVIAHVVSRLRSNGNRLIPFGLHLGIGGALIALIGETGYAVLLQSFLPWY